MQYFCCTVMELLFSEELGLVLEVSQLDVETVCQRYRAAGVECHRVGRTCAFGPEALVRHQPQHVSQAFSILSVTTVVFHVPRLSFRLVFVWMDRKY